MNNDFEFDNSNKKSLFIKFFVGKHDHIKLLLQCFRPPSSNPIILVLIQYLFTGCCSSPVLTLFTTGHQNVGFFGRFKEKAHNSLRKDFFL